MLSIICYDGFQVIKKAVRKKTILKYNVTHMLFRYICYDNSLLTRYYNGIYLIMILEIMQCSTGTDPVTDPRVGCKSRRVVQKKARK